MKIGLIGARGYVGEELLGLLQGHSGFEVAWVASTSHAGEPLRKVLANPDLPALDFVPADPAALEGSVDLIVLALPNGASGEYVAALGESRIIDLGADYRFDAEWIYGWPERRREKILGARRVANPGCYATAAQVALWPVIEHLTDWPQVFGVSGYSGAGRNPNARNDPERLRDNLLPYALSGHLHEREVSAQLGQQVSFTPHVASFFRGISMTVSATLDRKTSTRDMASRFERRYGSEPLVEVAAEVPEVRQVQGRCVARVGGFSVDSRDARKVTWVCCLDNLLKGAASQALQNMNLMCGFDELEGITHG